MELLSGGLQQQKNRKEQPERGGGDDGQHARVHAHVRRERCNARLLAVRKLLLQWLKEARGDERAASLTGWLSQEEVPAAQTGPVLPLFVSFLFSKLAFITSHFFITQHLRAAWTPVN
jgi:hypothetical protein